MVRIIKCILSALMSSMFICSLLESEFYVFMFLLYTHIGHVHLLRSSVICLIKYPAYLCSKSKLFVKISNRTDVNNRLIE